MSMAGFRGSLVFAGITPSAKDVWDLLQDNLGGEESTQVQVTPGWQLLETGAGEVGLHYTSLLIFASISNFPLEKVE